VTVKKIARQLVDLFVNDPGAEQLKKSGGGKEKVQLLVNGVNVDTYLHQFQWDQAKYKLSSPLSDIVDAIVGTVAKLEEELRQKSQSYQHLSSSLLAEKRKKTGTLLVRDLTDMIAAQPDVYVDSENLQSLFVVVSKHQTREWFGTYENLLADSVLAGGVVPGSATLLGDDADNNLYGIVLFRKLANDFKQEARKRKWTVRDWTFNKDAVSSGVEEQNKQESKRVKQRDNLIRWCRLNFAEAFIAWAHLKSIRVFVETILRYGLPADFTAILLEPSKKQDKKLRQVLDALYKGIGSVYVDEKDEEEERGADGGVQSEKFYSYVWTQLRVSLT